MFTRRLVLTYALWLAFTLSLAASVSHVAWAFNTLERPGGEWAGWVAALSVDCGLAALAYAIQQRKRARRGTLSLWAGVLAFASISAYANTLHALSVAGTSLAKALILSATLPALVVYLGEIVSSDDADAAERAERELRRSERQAERLTTQASEPVTLPATLPMQPASLGLSLPVAAPALVCDVCEREFANRFALSAHARSHANGKVKEIA